MKKFVSLLLVLMMTVSVCLLVSCGGTTETPTTNAATTGGETAAPTTAAPTTEAPKDPAAEVEAAIAKTAALNGYEVELKVTNKVTTDANVKNVEAVYTVAVDGKNAIGNRVVKVDDAQAQVDVYQADGTVYVNKGGEKTKGALTADAFKEYDLTALVLPLIVKPTVAGTAVEKDGGCEATYTLTAEELQASFPGFAKDLSDALSSGGASEQKITDAKVVIVVKGGYVVDYDVSFKISAKVGDKTVAGEAAICAAFKNPGTVPTVTAPADLSDYK